MRMRIRIQQSEINQDFTIFICSNLKVDNNTRVPNHFGIFTWTYIMFDTFKSEKTEKNWKKILKKVLLKNFPDQGAKKPWIQIRIGKKMLDPDPDLH